MPSPESEFKDDKAVHQKCATEGHMFQLWRGIFLDRLVCRVCGKKVKLGI